MQVQVIMMTAGSHSPVAVLLPAPPRGTAVSSNLQKGKEGSERSISPVRKVIELILIQDHLSFVPPHNTASQT